MFQKQRKIILELIPMVIELYNNRKINHKSFKEIWILDLLEMPKFNKYSMLGNTQCSIKVDVRNIFKIC